MLEVGAVPSQPLHPSLKLLERKELYFRVLDLNSEVFCLLMRLVINDKLYLSEGSSLVCAKTQVMNYVHDWELVSGKT